MSEYNWIETQSRIRGTGDNKVLRTIKIKVGRYNYSNDNTPDIYDYFCNQNCLHQFLRKFCREVANLNPTPKPKETPIKVRTEKYESYRYRWSGNEHTREPYQATRKIIENSS